MGERRRSALRTGFDGSLKLEFHGSRVTSDAGLLAYRELDEALALTVMAENTIPEWRTGRNTQHKVVALFRQSIFGRLAGYEDTHTLCRARFLLRTLGEVAPTLSKALLVAPRSPGEIRR